MDLSYSICNAGRQRNRAAIVMVLYMIGPTSTILESAVEMNVSRCLFWWILNSESQEMIHVFGRNPVELSVESCE